MQGWVAPLRFQLRPSQNCGATLYGSVRSELEANAGHERRFFTVLFSHRFGD